MTEKPTLQIGDLITFSKDIGPAAVLSDGSPRQFVVMGFDADGRAIVRDVSIEATVRADIAKAVMQP